MRFVKRCTCIPVPQVYMYNASWTNKLGYEWILMEHMPGQPLAEVQGGLSNNARGLVGRTIAEWMDSLCRLQFDKIGALYTADTASDDDGTVVISGTDCNPVIGQFVHQAYTGDWRTEYRFNRGPFHNLRDYLLSFAQASNLEIHDPRQRARAEIFAHLYSIRRHDYEARAQEHDDDTSDYDDDPEERLRKETGEERDRRRARIVEAEARLEEFLDEKIPKHWAGDGQAGQTMTVREAQAASPISFTGSRYDTCELEIQHSAADTLMDIINTVVPNTTLPQKSVVLYHWDMHGFNILVDGSTGQPTALLDWDRLNTIPRIFAQFYPSALQPNPLSPVPDWHMRMREAFVERLKELDSPWLAVKDGGDLSANDVLYQRILDVASDTYLNFVSVDSLEKELRSVGEVNISNLA